MLHQMSEPNSIIELLEEFTDTKVFQYDKSNRPTKNTIDHIKELSSVYQLGYSLNAKPFDFKIVGNQRLSTSDAVNPMPNRFLIGPFVVELQIESNSLNEASRLIPTFEQFNKTRLSKDQVLLRYGKNLELNVLKNFEIQLGSDSYIYHVRQFPDESQLMVAVQIHWFHPIISLIESYNKFKTPTIEADLSREYINYIQSMGNMIHFMGDSEQLLIKPTLDLTTQASFRCFNVTSRADLAIDYGFCDANGELKVINFSVIVEGKMPSANILTYLRNQLKQEESMRFSQQDQNVPNGMQSQTGKANFNNCFSKMLKLMTHSNCTKGIITDYTQLLLLEIQIENNEMVLYYSLLEPAKTEKLRYILFSFVAIHDYEAERVNRERVQEFLLRKLAENDSGQTNRDQSHNQQFWNSGDSSAATAPTTTTDFSLARFTGDINYDSYMTPGTAQSDSIDSDNVKEAVKIFGEYPYSPLDIARKFKLINTVMFNYQPKIMTVSAHELIEISSRFLEDLGYDLNSSELSTLGPKIIIKLAPLESLFIDNKYEDELEESGNIRFNQRLVDSIFNEIQIHMKVIEKFNDTFVVRLLHFGYLSDRTKYTNTRRLLNWRYIGPFIAFDKIENIQHLTQGELRGLQLEVKQKIIQCFEKLHSIDVIHNDFKGSNLYISPIGEVKILDFNRSYQSDSLSDKMEEMSQVKYMLGVS